MVHRGEEIPEGGHLALAHHQFLIVEDPKIIVGWSTEQIVVISDGDEDY